MRIMLILLVAALLVGGCGGDETTEPLTGVDLTELVTILPTPKGLDQSTEVASADAGDVQATFAGRAIPDVASEFEDLGFQEAVIRRWSAPGGADFLIVASRWDDHFTATNVGAGPGQLLLGTTDAQAWTPRALPGARGVRVTTPGREVRILSLAVEDISVFIRAKGPVSDAAVERTLDLAVKRLRSTPTTTA